MALDPFFDQPTEHSKVKTRIVSKYFSAWSNVMLTATNNRENIAYIDLFSGPGEYEDGTPSTPLQILGQAIKKNALQNLLITYFNDANPENTNVLQHKIKSLPGIGSLKNAPIIDTMEVDQSTVQYFEKIHVIPALIFLDPFGYKGLSLRLVASFLKDWGCDCIFFFNYNRIRPALSNPLVTPHMDSIFGSQRSLKLQNILKELSPDEANDLIVQELYAALTEDTNANYALRYSFKNESGARNTHDIIFATKSIKGYDIMKSIMATESTSRPQGVPSFEYNPSLLPRNIHQLDLIPYFRPLDELEIKLPIFFAGQTISMIEIFKQHNIGTKYMSANYKDALNLLEQKGKIIAKPYADKRRKVLGKVTFADRTMVNFPPFEGE